MTGIVLHVCIYLMVDCITNEDAFMERLEDTPILEHLPQGAAFGLLCTLIIMNLPLFVLDMQLIILHTYLTWNNLTTFEYIMGKKTSEYLEESHPGKSKHVLPRCLDWIVYRKRKKKKKATSDKIDQEPSSNVPS